MKLSYYIILAITAVSGCDTTEAGYARIQERFKTPTLQQTEIANCSNSIGNMPVQTRKNFAVLTGTTIENVPTIFCKRIAQGIASGRITREDYNSVNKGALTPSLLKVVQGR